MLLFKLLLLCFEWLEDVDILEGVGRRGGACLGFGGVCRKVGEASAPYLYETITREASLVSWAWYVGSRDRLELIELLARKKLVEKKNGGTIKDSTLGVQTCRVSLGRVEDSKREILC